MDVLISTITLLRENEVALLIKQLGDDSIKTKFLEFVKYKNVTQSEDLIKKLGYVNNISAFYTLKHRLLEDIITLKIQRGENSITKVRREVSDLKILLYSDNYYLLEKSLKLLEREVETLELFESKVDIYFYYLMLNYQNPKKRKEYNEKIKIAHKQYAEFSKMEILFFHLVFQSIDVFYLYTDHLSEELNPIIAELESYFNSTQSKVAEFFWLSSKITTELSLAKKGKLKVQEKDIIKLKDLYNDKAIKYRYPNCEFAIECLANKFYFLTGMEVEFNNSLNELQLLSKNIKGYRMFENVYFYYLFITIHSMVLNKRFNEISKFVKDHLSNETIEASSDKIKFYYFYIQAIGLLHAGKFSDAQSILLNARNYKNMLEPNNGWILAHNYGLIIWLALITKSYSGVNYELEKLRKLISKIELYNEHWKKYTSLIKHIVKNKNKAKIQELSVSFTPQAMSKSTMLLFDMDYILPFMVK